MGRLPTPVLFWGINIMAAIREAGFDDYSAIMALKQRFDLSVRGREAWEHLWWSNPAMPKDPGTWPIGWVLEDPRQQVVGYLGNIPVRYEFRQRPLLVAVATSWVVLPEYRNYSLALLGRYINQPHVDLLVNSTANAEAARVFSALKFHPIPTLFFNSIPFWILNYPKTTAAFLRNKGLPLAQVISHPLALALKLRDFFLRKNRCKEKPALEILNCLTFDDRFETFWNDLKTRHSHKLLCVRDKISLEWHFKFALMQNKLQIFTIENKNGLASYAIFLETGPTKSNLRWVRLVDFQSLDNDPEVFIEMVFHGIRQFRGHGVDILEIEGFEERKRRSLQLYHPYQLLRHNCPFYYQVKDPCLHEELDNLKVWDPCLYDGESSL
jgi:hypothetical protein